jgi:hypothetical protein
MANTDSLSGDLGPKQIEEIIKSAVLSSTVEADGLNKITVSTTAPTSPTVGDLWVDTS